MYQYVSTNQEARLAAQRLSRGGNARAAAAAAAARLETDTIDAEKYPRSGLQNDRRTYKCPTSTQPESQGLRGELTKNVCRTGRFED